MRSAYNNMGAIGSHQPLRTGPTSISSTLDEAARLNRNGRLS